MQLNRGPQVKLIMTILVIINIGSQVLWGQASTLTVYSHRHYEADKKIFLAFTEQTGIKVQVLQGDADQLLQRLKAEGKESPADILITADVGRLYLAKKEGLLQAISSPELQRQIPAHLRDKDNNWFALTKRARVFVYDSTKSKPTIRNYEDLAKPEFKGKVLIRSSSNIYSISLLGGLIAHWGKDQTALWLKGLVANLAQSPKGGDRDQIKAVAAGIGTLAVSNTYYLGQLAHSKDPAEQAVAKKMGVIFPNQDSYGTHINISGAGVLASSKKQDAARKFLEYLISAEAQAVFAAENFEYPVRSGVALSPIVASWGSFKEDAQSLEVLGQNSAEALKLADTAGYK
jgi:iron(III) transport system substrate-binding protein